MFGGCAQKRMDKFTTVLNIFKQQTNLGCGLIALVTAGGERIFSTAVFKCPCSSWNFVYGIVFLMVPALILLVLGYLLNQKTWKLMTGICLQKSKLCQWKKLVARGKVFFQITATAVVAPFSWIAVALLNGNYFECAMTGVNFAFIQNHLCGNGTSQLLCRQELHKFPCDGQSIVTKANIQGQVLANVRAESQIIGWMLIASIVVCSLALMCLARCHSPISFHHLKFWQLYSQQENNLLETYSAEHAKKLANRNLKSFFHQERPEEIVTPSNKDWNKISAFYRFSPSDHFYSTMHQYVEHHEDTNRVDMMMGSIRSDGPCADNPSVLSFVDQGGMGL